MDLLRRLFGGDEGTDPGKTATNGSDPNPVDGTDESVTVDGAAGSSAPPAAGGLATADAASGETTVAWRKVATHDGHSEYTGELDGDHVATITKLPKTSGQREPWQWHVDVVVTGPATGTTKTLKDAKPAAEGALRQRVR